MRSTLVYDNSLPPPHRELGGFGCNRTHQEHCMGTRYENLNMPVHDFAPFGMESSLGLWLGFRMVRISQTQLVHCEILNSK